MDFLKNLQSIKQKSREEKLRKLEHTKELRSLPFVYGLFSIAFSSGLSVEQSLRATSIYFPKQTQQPIANTLHDLDSGKPFSNASQHMSNVKSLRPLTHIMLETYELGNDALGSLDGLNKEAMSNIARETEKAIKKLPVTMLFPLVVCILPAFILLSIVPTIVGGLMAINW